MGPDIDKAERIITDNRVLLHHVANTLNYLDIRTVVVSCGTCHDQLQDSQFEKIFPGAASSMNDRCCGESGTFAISRPDIATQVRFRKEQEGRGVGEIRKSGHQGDVKVLNVGDPHHATGSFGPLAASLRASFKDSRQPRSQHRVVSSARRRPVR